MKRIGILTYHKSYNCGAVLQAHALQLAVQRLGYDCCVVDYGHIGEASRFLFRSSGFRPFLGAVKRFVLSLGVEDAKRRSYLRFREREMRLSPHYVKTSDIPVLQYHRFVTGSDQVWHPVISEGEAAYFLDFADDRQKVAYAPSFGVEVLPAEFEAVCRNWLPLIPALSAREEAGQRLIRRLTGRDVPIVCDPTLLLSADDYGRMEAPCRRKKPYVCVYAIGEHPWMTEVAVQVARERGLEVVMIVGGGFAQWRFRRGVRYRSAVGPAEFLSYLHHAEFVVTNSFHGTVFSLIYQKPFYACANTNGANSRIETLLRHVGLEARLLARASDDRVTCQCSVDFSQSSRRLDVLREGSLTFLRQALD